MGTLKKYNLDGKHTGDVAILDSFVKVRANSQMIKDYIVAIRANARQWSASTKDRSEVKHTTKKSHPQKKTGRARHGSIVAAQFKGGGVVFGPRPKFDQHTRINKKERRNVIKHFLSERMKAGDVILLEDTTMETPRTKTLSSFMQNSGLSRKKVLFLGESSFDEVEENGVVKRVMIPTIKHAHFVKSMCNIPRTSFSLATNVNGYDLMNAKNIVLTEKALSELTQWLG